MQLLTHFVKAATNGAISAASMLPIAAHHLIASPSNSYKATANRASKRTTWYSTFGAAATWSSIG
ncbi:MAG: hypothetical protein AABY37_01400 [Actinomycetota bacterium]